VLADRELLPLAAFALNEATLGHPLSTLAFFLFSRCNFISRFSVSRAAATLLTRALLLRADLRRRS
jgi:hypothetical protein